MLSLEFESHLEIKWLITIKAVQHLLLSPFLLMMPNTSLEAQSFSKPVHFLFSKWMAEMLSFGAERGSV